MNGAAQAWELGSPRGSRMGEGRPGRHTRPGGLERAGTVRNEERGKDYLFGSDWGGAPRRKGMLGQEALGLEPEGTD